MPCNKMLQLMRYSEGLGARGWGLGKKVLKSMVSGIENALTAIAVAIIHEQVPLYLQVPGIRVTPLKTHTLFHLKR